MKQATFNICRACTATALLGLVVTGCVTVKEKPASAETEEQARADAKPALTTGAVDGQENPLTNIYSAKLHEITPYITLTGHKYESTPVVASMVWWSGLDEATQECIEGAAEQAGWYQRGLSLSQGKSLRETMEAEGATFAEVEDRQAFIDATAGVYDQYEGDYSDLIGALREATQ